MSGMTSEREFDSLNSNSPTSEKEMVFGEARRTRSRSRITKRVLMFATLIAVSGIICAVIGVVFLERAQRISPDCKPDTKETGKPLQPSHCAYSEELLRSGLLQFFSKVEDAYYTHQPFDIPYKYRVSRGEVKKKFLPYNPTPENIKATADSARSLIEDLNNMDVRKELLKPREAKTLAKTRHFLEQNFGNAYDNGYYTGVWMLGPSRFCYMQLFTRLSWNLRAFLARLQPKTLEDVELLLKTLKGYGQGIKQYKNNIEMGVKVGMVNSIEECKVGYDCLASKFPAISLAHSVEDVLKERFIPSLLGQRILEGIKDVTQPWLKKYKKSLTRSLKEAIVDNLGVPLADLFRYLSGEYRTHCVPSNVSSGLATRPVQFVYNHGKPNFSAPTTKILPSGGRVSGKGAYERLIRFFTTTKMTPETVHKLGWTVLRSLYPQVVEIARTVTGIFNESEAIAEFRVLINSSAMYFNEKPFPTNESEERAYILCKTPMAAELYCPVRYATLQKWFKYSQSTLSMLEPKLLRMFHWMVGPKKTTPICPVSMATNFLPSTGSQSYTSAGPSCRQPGRYYLPFFLDRMGPKYSEWSVNAHEAMPGHHMQSQGYSENFQDPCNPLLGPLQRSMYGYTAFSEGWALYAENPLIATDTRTYDRNPLQKYGMLKWQIWRALRLIVDTGIHYKGMTRTQALILFRQYAWDDSDVAKKEVTRYQSGPGQATAYMIGQRAIISMREKAKKRLGKRFDLKNFHYHLLSRGPAPLSFMKEQITKVSECELDREGPGCEYILVDKVKKRTTAQSFDEMIQEEMTSPHVHEL